MKQLHRCVLFVLLVVAVTASVSAQDYPWPTHVSQPPSVCPPNYLKPYPSGGATNEPFKKRLPTGMTQVNDQIDTIRSVCPNYPNLPLPQYSGPLTSFRGRFVDSNRVRDFQSAFGMRTLRANKVIVAPETNRVYMIIGSTFAQWDTATFFARLAAGNLVNNAYFGVYRIGAGYPIEKHLQWQGFAYPEGDIYQERWKWVIADGQDRLFGIDYDDRGYVYLAYSIYGWAILGPDLEPNAPPLSQTTVDVTPSGRALSILSFKSAGRYYALVSDAEIATSLYDTTNPAAPQFITKLTFGMFSGARVPSANGHVVALATTAGNLRLYDGASLAAGGTPLNVFTPTGGGFFPQVDADGSTFFAVENRDMSPLRLAIIRNTGGSWTSQTYQAGESFRTRGIRAGGGYVTVYGDNSQFQPDVRIFRMVDGVPNGVSTDFFPRFYQGYDKLIGDPDFDGRARPSGYMNPVYDAVPASYGGTTFLFYSGGGLGDVYEINGSGGPLPTPTPTPSPTPGGTPTPTPTPGGTPTPTPGGGSCNPPQLLYFDYTPATAAPGVPLTFRPLDYYVLGRFSGSCSDTFQWTFGDGTSSNQKNPIKVYNTGGQYTVTLVVNGAYTANGIVNLGGGGGTPTPTPTPGGTPTPTPTPAPGPCAAPQLLDINYTCATGTCASGFAVNFRPVDFYNSTRFSGGCADTFLWNFGDGTQSTERAPSKTYASGGNYNVSVTVNGVYPANRQVTIAGGGGGVTPITSVDFTASATSVTVGTAVTFTASALPDDNNVNFTWDFDGNANTVEATGKQVQYTWTAAGNYRVTLKAFRGSEAQASKDIRVTPKNSFAFLLPVVAHVPGQNNTRWRTDLQIYNTDPGFTPANPLRLDVEFKGQHKELVNDSSTYIREDFMTFFTTGDDAGPMIVRGTAANVPQMWTRTYTVSESGVGTFGQLINAIPLDPDAQNLVLGSSRYYLAGLENTGRFRTNVGLINPTPTQVTIEVTAYDDKGFPYGSFTENVGPYALSQINDIKARIPSLPNDAKYSLRISNLAGTQLVAYQSTIDQVSNDPVYIEALADDDSLNADMKVQWVPGVAHLTNGSWRTDFTVFNPDEQGMQLDVTYFDASGSEVSKVASYPLSAKSFVSLKDILRSGVFNVPADKDSFGTIKVETKIFAGSQRFPLVYSRTYSDQLAAGTFGQGIPGFSQPNVTTTEPAYIAGVRSNSSYQTNVGVLSLATSGTTKVKVVLLDKLSGAEIGAWTYDLAPHQLVIHPDAIRAMHPTADSGSLRFTLIQGGPVWAFASIIDKLTKDAEYVPAIGFTPAP